MRTFMLIIGYYGFFKKSVNRHLHDGSGRLKGTYRIIRENYPLKTESAGWSIR